MVSSSAEDEGHGRVVHLEGEGVLGLPRRGHTLMGVVHPLALGGHAAHDLEAHSAHDGHEGGPRA